MGAIDILPPLFSTWRMPTKNAYAIVPRTLHPWCPQVQPDYASSTTFKNRNKKYASSTSNVSRGFRSTPTLRSNRFQGIAQPFLTRMGSNFGGKLYTYGVFLGQEGKGPCASLVELDLKDIWLDIEGFSRKKIWIRGLGGLWIAGIITFTLYIFDVWTRCI